MEIRVLQILDTLNTGSGVASVVLSFYRAMEKLSENGDRFIFDFMINEEVKDSVKKMLEMNGSKIFLMPSLRLISFGQYLMELKRFFSNHKEYSIVHGHMPNAAAFYFCIAKHYGVAVRILHSHNSKGADRRWNRIRNRILSNIGIQFATEYMACGKKAAHYLYGKDISKVYLLNNVVDTEKFSFQKEVREQVREQLGVCDRFVIGHVGRFCYQKNQKFLLKIFVELLKREKSVYLFLIGDGEERGEIEQLVEQYHLQKSVKLFGVVSQVEKYMQAMDVFLLPSRYEGVPVVILEAQASGLPCVLSSEVTREVETEYTSYIDLEESAGKWSEAVLEWKGKARCGYLSDKFNYIADSTKLYEKYKEFYREKDGKR